MSERERASAHTVNFNVMEFYFWFLSRITLRIKWICRRDVVPLQLKSMEKIWGFHIKKRFFSYLSYFSFHKVFNNRLIEINNLKFWFYAFNSKEGVACEFDVLITHTDSKLIFIQKNQQEMNFFCTRPLLSAKSFDEQKEIFQMLCLFCIVCERLNRREEIRFFRECKLKS